MRFSSLSTFFALLSSCAFRDAPHAHLPTLGDANQCLPNFLKMLLLALPQIYTRVFHLWQSIELESSQSRRHRATRRVILTNFGSISRNLGDISASQRLSTNSRRLCSSVNWREENFFTDWLWAVWPKYSYLVTRKSPRPSYAKRDFDQVWVDQCRNLSDVSEFQGL